MVEPEGSLRLRVVDPRDISEALARKAEWPIDWHIEYLMSNAAVYEVSDGSVLGYFTLGLQREENRIFVATLINMRPGIANLKRIIRAGMAVARAWCARHGVDAIAWDTEHSVAWRRLLGEPCTINGSTVTVEA